MPPAKRERRGGGMKRRLAEAIAVAFWLLVLWVTWKWRG